MELHVDRMQIDNGLYHTPYPIMLWPVLPPNMQVLQLALVHSKEWKTITFIRYFSFLLQQVDIRVEEVALLRLLDFVQLFLALVSQRTESDEEKKLLNSFKVEEFTRRESFDLAKRFYFELLALNPIKAHVSFQNMPARTDAGASSNYYCVFQSVLLLRSLTIPHRCGGHEGATAAESL